MPRICKIINGNCWKRALRAKIKWITENWGGKAANLRVNHLDRRNKFENSQNKNWKVSIIFYRKKITGLQR